MVKYLKFHQLGKISPNLVTLVGLKWKWPNNKNSLEQFKIETTFAARCTEKKLNEAKEQKV